MKINIINLIKFIIKFLILFTIFYIIFNILLKNKNNNIINNNNDFIKQSIIYSFILSLIISSFSIIYKIENFDDFDKTIKHIEASNDDDNDDKTEKIEIEEETIKDINDDIDKKDDKEILIDKEETKTEELNDKDKTLIAEYEDTINKMETNPAYRSNDNIITDENIYDQYGGGLNANSLYIPRDYKLSDPLDAQYYQIPPQYWVGGSFGMVQPPVCSPANGRCKISNICTSGYPSNSVEVNYVPLKNYFEATKILGPDGINVKYIEDKLNTAH